jgi:hypothetical protein
MRVLSILESSKTYKLNLFIYGLYRKKTLDELIDMNPVGNPGEYNDALLPAQAALSGGLRYVDEVLLIKLAKDKPFRHRLPDDPLVAVRRRYKGYNRI